MSASNHVARSLHAFTPQLALTGPSKMKAPRPETLPTDMDNVKDKDDEKIESKVRTRDLNVFYGDKQALFDVDLEIPRNQVTALIGPSG